MPGRRSSGCRTCTTSCTTTGRLAARSARKMQPSWVAAHRPVVCQSACHLGTAVDGDPCEWPAEAPLEPVAVGHGDPLLRRGRHARPRRGRARPFAVTATALDGGHSSPLMTPSPRRSAGPRGGPARPRRRGRPSRGPRATCPRSAGPGAVPGGKAGVPQQVRQVALDSGLQRRRVVRSQPDQAQLSDLHLDRWWCRHVHPRTCASGKGRSSLANSARAARTRWRICTGADSAAA